MTYDLKSSLDGFAETAYADAPPSTIDIGRARADGRRRIAAARLVPIGGGVAVIAACALLVNTLGGTSPAGDGVKAGPGGTAPHRTFTGTDPLVSVGTFGWLPDGFTVARYTAGPDYGDNVIAFAAATTPKAGAVPDPQAGLTLTRWSSEPKLPEYKHKTEMSLKGSKKAYLVANPASGPGIPDDLSVLWQTESGSWYALGGDYAIHGDELKALLTKVAESVRTEESPVPMPFHIEGLPKDLVLGSAELDGPMTLPGGSGVAAGLLYRNGGDAVQPVGNTVSIWVEPAGGPKSPAAGKSSGQANQNKGQSPDLPAQLLPYSDANDSQHACKESAGLRVCVRDVPGPHPNGVDPLASIGGVKGLLDRVTSLGTDPANWTTHVVN